MSNIAENHSQILSCGTGRYYCPSFFRVSAFRQYHYRNDFVGPTCTFENDYPNRPNRIRVRDSISSRERTTRKGNSKSVQTCFQYQNHRSNSHVSVLNTICHIQNPCRNDTYLTKDDLKWWNKGRITNNYVSNQIKQFDGKRRRLLNMEVYVTCYCDPKLAVTH